MAPRNSGGGPAIVPAARSSAGEIARHIPVPIAALTLFRTPVPFWGQITWN